MIEVSSAATVNVVPPESHPDAKLFPLMNADDLFLLTQDIAQNGLFEAIGLYEGKVLDGRNRLRACIAAGVEPRYFEIELKGQRPIEYVLSKNLRRRQLTTVQLALLALDVIPYYKEEALVRKNRGRGGMLPEEESQRGKTAERVGDVIGISGDTVRRMIAIQKVDPEIIELMRRGRYVSVRAASIAAGLVVSYSSPAHKPDTVDRWEETFTPVAVYLRNWLGNPPEISKTEAKARLRHLHLLRHGLEQLEQQLEEQAGN